MEKSVPKQAADNVKEASKAPAAANFDLPSPKEVRDFFSKVSQDDLQDRQAAKQILGDLQFKESRDRNGDFVLKEVTADKTNKKILREIGRVHLNADGTRTEEELQYFATGKDGSSIQRKTDKSISPNLETTTVFEGATKDHFSPTRLLEQSYNERALKDGSEVSSATTTFEYSKAGSVIGETQVYARLDSTETLRFEGEALREKSDTTVYRDSTPQIPHQDTKTYEYAATGQRLVDVEQEKGTTVTSTYSRASDDADWRPELKRAWRDGRTEQIYPQK